MGKDAKQPDANQQLKWMLSQMAGVEARYVKKCVSVQLRLRRLVPREMVGM